ncbi:hypothetical protein K1719_002445 [Acacia pycnantha]|nr:hypothetical protein K1719_002445 [Acacia pycnantha]
MELPEDAMFEIFSWLHAKSIFKFRSCSKSISEFTKKETFALKQAQNFMLEDDSSFFMQGTFLQNNNYKFKTELHALPGNELSSGIPRSFLQSLDESALIIASSNGLLLIQALGKNSSKRKYFICNPVTQLSYSIPTPYFPLKGGISQYPQVIFAIDCIHDEEYQLIIFEKNLEKSYYVCKVYLPKEGAWRERQKGLFLDDDDYSMLYGSPIFYQGNFNFVTICYSSKRINYYMSSYNLETGETRSFNFPKAAVEIGGQLVQYKNLRIYKWGKVGSSDESICVVSLFEDFVFNIWVFTGYKSSSWLRLMSLSLEEMGLENGSFVYGFTVMNGDSLVFATKWDVYRFVFIGARERRLEKIGEHRVLPQYHSDIDFIPHTNTLRSCGAYARDLSFIFK